MKEQHILSNLPFCTRFFTTSFLTIFLCSAGANATPAHYTPLPGDELDLSVPCATTHIHIDPTLKTGLSFDDNTDKALTFRKIKNGAETRIHAALATCQSAQHLSLHLAPGTTLTLHDSPHANINITGTLSTLESNVTNTTLSLDHVQSLDLTARGETTVQIEQLDRIAEISTFNNSIVRINNALLSALSAHTNDTSQLSIHQGQIDTFALTAISQSNVSVLAQINSATTTVQDNASLTLHHVVGTFSQSGNGHIHQLEETKATLTPKTSPSAPIISTDGSAQGLENPSTTPPVHPTPNTTLTPTPTSTPSTTEHAPTPSTPIKQQQPSPSQTATPH